MIHCKFNKYEEICRNIIFDPVTKNVYLFFCVLLL